MPKQQDACFLIKEENGQIASIERKQEKIAEAAKVLGVFGILSHGISLTADEILLYCRRRDGIKAGYDNMKNHLDCYRLRIHSDQAMKGKFFIAFLAQILYAELSRTLWSPEIDPKTLPIETSKQLLIELEKIRLVEYESANELFRPLTGKQKGILTLFGIEADDFCRKATELEHYD
ncbi:MAG: hypothetical protein QM296_11710 [Bacillota bacterium]|nr:hypothetical protein [Bacillota bacterium]